MNYSLSCIHGLETSITTLDTTKRIIIFLTCDKFKIELNIIETLKMIYIFFLNFVYLPLPAIHF